MGRFDRKCRDILDKKREPGKGFHHRRKAGTVLALLSFLISLLGCGRGANYSADDIVLINTAYYGTESIPVYSFGLYKQESSWFFSADCRVGEQSEHYTSFSSFPIPKEDAEEFLAVIREEKEIDRLVRTQNPLRFLPVSDASSQSVGMTFSDGNKIEKNTSLCDRALDFLYKLANRHYKTAEAETIRGISITRQCMTHFFSYSFQLEKEADSYFLSFDAAVDDSVDRIEAEDQRIDGESAEEIFAIVRDQQLVSQVLQYEEPEDESTFALDETTYTTQFEFADGHSIYAPINAGEELTEAFYRLAKKYQ